MVQEVIAFIAANWPLILAGLGALVTLASVIVKLTPTRTDDMWFDRFLVFWSMIDRSGNWKRPLKK